MRSAVFALVLLLAARAPAAPPATADWPVTGGDAGGSRFSPLADIDRGNVSKLRVAWTYRHGDLYDGGWLPHYRNKGTAFESTPIVVDGRLIFTTPFNRVIALDPETGAELWTFDPKIDRDRIFANMMINRGVAHWRAPAGEADAACATRVFLATLDARLIALDAASGRPCADFGSGGTVNLLEGIEPVVDPWEYNVTSPPTVVGDAVVTGSSIADLIRRREPPGHVRAFDARSGRLLWTFHTIPREGEAGVETWEDESWRTTGTANVWSTITADLERGLAFLPVSTAGPDHFGGDRRGANLFADSVVALRAHTGERVWHFQTVHHDLWDYDLAAPPNLVRVRHAEREIDAVAQATKTGFVFLLDRETGEPLFPVEEKPVPASDVPGEQAWSTQPIPTRPPPLVPQRLDDAGLWSKAARHVERCRARLSELRNDGLFTPPSLRGSIVHPFTAGGANWSGGSFDPASHLLYVPVNNDVHVVRLKPLPGSYEANPDGVVLHSTLRAAWWFLTGRGTDLRYHVERNTLRVDDLPCQAPPWGSLVAVDLDRGSIRWSVPAGEDKALGVRGLSNFGPPLATAGGLVFHAGTRELRLRAHDAATGEVIASFELPAGLHAGPITYKLRPDGKQFLVIAPGGHIGLGSKLGDHVIAYALPDEP
jgi:quinoprotein glucose dehydrogenase